MTIIQVFQKTAPGDRFRRKSSPQVLLTVDEDVKHIVYVSNTFDDPSRYSFTVDDLVAKDWEIERKTWSSR